jgi:tetratricopeptide (TPR) repeat protein
MMHSIQHVRRRSLKTWIGSVSSALAAGTLGFGLLATSSSFAADAPKGPQISRSIAKELIAAQKALQANQFVEGLKNLDAAAAVSGLTPYDHKTIDELRAFAYIKTNNLKGAQQSYEDAIATGVASAEEVSHYSRGVFQIAYSTQQYPKAIEYGKKLIESDTANGDTYLMVTQSYYLEKDCKNAVIWSDKSIAYARKAGEAPKENLFLFKLSCAFDANDTAATIATLEELIRLNGKTEYWNKLLRFELQDEKEDRNILMIYRVMLNTNSFTSGSNYIEMAQLLGDAPALPGEAEAVLEKGLSTGTISADQKDRVSRLQTSLKARAETDRKDLSQFAAEAAKNPSGDLSVKLGEVYYGFGDYANTVSVINQGLQKGQIKRPEEAYVYLGLAQNQLKNAAEAKKAFAQLKSVPNVSPKILKLWQLFAERIS